MRPGLARALSIAQIPRRPGAAQAAESATRAALTPGDPKAGRLASRELAGTPPEVLAGLATALSTAANSADAGHRLVFIVAEQDADGYSRWVATAQLPAA